MIPRQLVAIVVVMLVFGVGFVALAQSPSTATTEAADSFELTTTGHSLSTPANHSGVAAFELVDRNDTALVEGIDYDLDRPNATVAGVTNSSALNDTVRAEYRLTVPDSQGETFATVLSTFGPVAVGLTVILVVALIGSRVFP
jgi:hypothetical protein